MNHVDFAAPPPLGTIIELDTQRYELAKVEPYRRGNGSVSSLLTWITACPDCGGGFEATTGLVSKSLNRRCAMCRSKRRSVGAPVSGRRGRRIKVRVLYP